MKQQTVLQNVKVMRKIHPAMIQSYSQKEKKRTNRSSQIIASNTIEVENDDNNDQKLPATNVRSLRSTNSNNERKDIHATIEPIVYHELNSSPTKKRKKKTKKFFYNSKMTVTKGQSFVVVIIIIIIIIIIIDNLSLNKYNVLRKVVFVF